MRAKDVIDHLKVHIAPPAYAFLEQVADGTGARQNRWADAVAMSVWPSRGYDVHGFEVKVSRSDWIGELKNPLKSAAVQQFCNRWWIATPDESIIHPGELPPTWGWMICKGTGMKVVVPAPALTPVPLTHEFVASVLRNFARADEKEVEKRIEEAKRQVREDESDYSRKQYAELSKAVDEFQEASGIYINRYSGGKELGESVQTLRHLGSHVSQLEHAIKACRRVEEMLTEVQKLADLNTSIKKPVDVQLDTEVT